MHNRCKRGNSRKGAVSDSNYIKYLYNKRTVAVDKEQEYHDDVVNRGDARSGNIKEGDN